MEGSSSEAGDTTIRSKCTRRGARTTASLGSNSVDITLLKMRKMRRTVRLFAQGSLLIDLLLVSTVQVRRNKPKMSSINSQVTPATLYKIAAAINLVGWNI